MYTHMYAKKGKGGGDAGAEADFIGEGRSYTIALKCSKNHTLTLVYNHMISLFFFNAQLIF